MMYLALRQAARRQRDAALRAEELRQQEAAEAVWRQQQQAQEVELAAMR